MFLLRQRRPATYGAASQLALGPGHPLYEQIRGEVLAKDADEGTSVLDTIDALLEDMRQRRLANEAVLAEWQAEDGDGAGEAAD